MKNSAVAYSQDEERDVQDDLESQRIYFWKKKENPSFPLTG